MRQEQFDKLSRDEQRRLVGEQYGGVELGNNSPLIDLAKPKRAHRNLEDEHVREHILPFFVGQGFDVNVTSVIGKKPTGVTPGIPDIYCQSATKDNFWFEAKLPGNRLSEAQHKFMQRCQRGNEFYVMGTVAEAKAFCDWYDVEEARGCDPYEWYLSDEFAEQLETYGWRPPKKKRVG